MRMGPISIYFKDGNLHMDIAGQIFSQTKDLCHHKN